MFPQDIDLVLDEELQLSRELEKAQESALAYAVQEEENWLKELAREQSSQVDVDLEEAIDLGVSINILLQFVFLESQ